MLRRFSGAGAAAGALLAVVGCVAALLLAAPAPWRPQPAALESAILPPRAVRRWFYSTTRVTSGANNEVPLDRFAGHGRGRRTAAKVPGWGLDQEAKQARLAYQQTYAGLEPQIKELDEELKHFATWDHGHGDGRSADGASGAAACAAACVCCPTRAALTGRAGAGKERETAELEARRKALDEQIANAKAGWRQVQDKVDKYNKELVNGRARKFNSDRYLGGSDHFVSVGDAHTQLAGAGYGHR